MFQDSIKIAFFLMKISKLFHKLISLNSKIVFYFYALNNYAINIIIIFLIIYYWYYILYHNSHLNDYTQQRNKKKFFLKQLFIFIF